jgi:hypothetical protein
LPAGSVFQVPLLRYDKAGHLIPSDEVQYFVLPKTDFESNLDTLQSDVRTLYNTTNDLTQLGASNKSSIDVINN